jgi:arylsulfatase A-like enzyme/Tfp pilus assembly protein PilF
LFIVLLPVACLLTGCARQQADRVAAPPPDVVLITIDTLRADRVGVYGGLPATTPNLDRLAGRGVAFMDATAHVPLTAPSHASILTGLYPPHHALRDNGGFVLSPRASTLAELLRAHGYHTAAFVASYVLNRGTGLARGFETYGDRFDTAGSHPALLGLQRRGPEVARDAIGWLATAPHPFFLWVHLYDPHTPYDPPPAFASRFPGQPYEAEIAASDWAVGEVLRAIDAKSKNALVIATADHGESLGEHGEKEHGLLLYDATLRVPLIVAGPAIRSGGRVAQQVRHVDIVPTVLDWAHLSPAVHLDGVSLRPLIEGQAAPTTPSYSETLFGRLHFGWSELTAVRNGQFKFVKAPAPELYDVRADPGERANILPRRRETAATLSKALATLAGPSSDGTSGTTAPLESAEAERLRSLGYVSGRVEIGAERGADPKTQIAAYEDYVARFTQGVDALQAGRQPEAERTFRDLARRFPDSYEVHQYLGRSFAARGAHDEAIRAFDAAHRLSPQTALVEYDVAKSLAAKRQFDAALEHVNKGLALEPDTFYGYLAKGEVLRLAGDRTKAAEALQKALALSPGLAIAEFELGRLAEDGGDWPGARQHYQRALSSDATMVNARNALTRVERRQHAQGRP